MANIKELPPLDRPRERLLSAGGGALSDCELVAILFGGDLDRATTLVGRFGGAGGLLHAGLGELCDTAGIGVARACQLQAALELGRRALVAPLARGAIIRTPDEVAAQLADLGALEEEELHVLGLDTRNRLLCRFVAARGALNTVHVSPRDVLRRLVREAAASMIVAHNHPSGDPAPSLEDIDLTRRLHDAGSLLGVPLLDHLVITRTGFHSFADDIRRLRALDGAGTANE